MNKKSSISGHLLVADPAAFPARARSSRVSRGQHGIPDLRVPATTPMALTTQVACASSGEKQ